VAADTVCSSDSHWCTLVQNLTHNETLARAADWLIARPLSILALFLIGFLVRWLLHRLIDRLARRAANSTVPAVITHGKMHQLFPEPDAEATARRHQRIETMASLLKSITTAVIATIVLFMTVAQLGYNIAPLIASAGIIGVALGFGAQSLVKDFLSGIFMILEDQYGVGDTVNVGTATGTIEAVGLRVTRLRDLNGTVWYIRNGEILAVGNMSHRWSRVVLDVPVAYSADLSVVRGIIKEEADELWEDREHGAGVLEEPEVWGVERWDPDGAAIRLVLKTTPAAGGNIARALRERIKARFDEEGVEIPLPQRVVWHHDLRESSAEAPQPDRRA
jgi:small-conductance mechanosensitive channel